MKYPLFLFLELINQSIYHSKGIIKLNDKSYHVEFIEFKPPVSNYFAGWLKNHTYNNEHPIDKLYSFLPEEQKQFYKNFIDSVKNKMPKFTENYKNKSTMSIEHWKKYKIDMQLNKKEKEEITGIKIDKLCSKNSQNKEIQTAQYIFKTLLDPSSCQDHCKEKDSNMYSSDFVKNSNKSSVANFV